MGLRPCLLIALCLIIALPANAEWGYVAFSGSQSATPFQPDDHTLGTSFSLQPGTYPYDATMRPDGEEVWCPGATGDRVMVIDRAGSGVSHNIPVGDYPVSVAFSNDGSFALVSCRDSDRLDIIDTASHSVIGSLPIPDDGGGPGNLALDPVSGKFYLVEWYGNLLYEIAPDASTIQRQASLGTNLWQLVVDPDGSTVYVTDRGNDLLRAIDRASLTQVNTLAVGDDPWGIDITHDGATLVVCCEDDNTLQIVDASAWSATWYTFPPSKPRDVDILDSLGKAYVSGGQIAGSPAKVYEFDLTLLTITYNFVLWDSDNPNVVAVQPQMAADYTAAPATPMAARLSAQPNPFNPSTLLRFALPIAGPARLSLHDVQGRELGILLNGWQAAGEQNLRWGGRDAQGRPLPAGLYLARLRSTAGTQTIKLALLK